MPYSYLRDPDHSARAAEGSGFFIIWCPTSDQPSRVVFPTHRQAEVVAEKMAAKEPGSRFYVLEAVSVSEARSVTTRNINRQFGGG